jgi:hypothetical protein
MTDEGTSTATPALSAQEQARIRRERRQAKVREGGSSRLSRITATQGTDFRREGKELRWLLTATLLSIAQQWLMDSS